VVVSGHVECHVRVDVRRDVRPRLEGELLVERNPVLEDDVRVDQFVVAFHAERGCRAIGDPQGLNQLKTRVHSLVDRVEGDVAREGYHESRRCSRDTYPESYIT